MTRWGNGKEPYEVSIIKDDRFYPDFLEYMPKKEVRKMNVYLVKQTQPNSGYEDKTIYVLSDVEKAQKYARKLNKEYAQNVNLSDEGDFIDVIDYMDWDMTHYYDVECMVLDEDLA